MDTISIDVALPILINNISAPKRISYLVVNKVGANLICELYTGAIYGTGDVTYTTFVNGQLLESVTVPITTNSVSFYLNEVDVKYITYNFSGFVQDHLVEVEFDSPGQTHTWIPLAGIAQMGLVDPIPFPVTQMYGTVHVEQRTPGGSDYGLLLTLTDFNGFVTVYYIDSFVTVNARLPAKFVLKVNPSNTITFMLRPFRSIEVRKMNSVTVKRTLSSRFGAANFSQWLAPIFINGMKYRIQVVKYASNSYLVQLYDGINAYPVAVQDENVVPFDIICYLDGYTVHIELDRETDNIKM